MELKAAEKLQSNDRIQPLYTLHFKLFTLQKAAKLRKNLSHPKEALQLSAFLPS
jgi:hypothetical protein